MTKIIAAREANEGVSLRKLTVTVNGEETVFENGASETELAEVSFNSGDSVTIKAEDIAADDTVSISHTLQFIVDSELSEIIIPE